MTLLIFFGGVGVAIVLMVVTFGIATNAYGDLNDAATAVLFQGLIFMVLCGIAALLIFR
jgi:hypothetical protein